MALQDGCEGERGGSNGGVAIAAAGGGGGGGGVDADDDSDGAENGDEMMMTRPAPKTTKTILITTKIIPITTITKLIFAIGTETETSTTQPPNAPYANSTCHPLPSAAPQPLQPPQSHACPAAARATRGRWP